MEYYLATSEEDFEKFHAFLKNFENLYNTSAVMSYSQYPCFISERSLRFGTETVKTVKRIAGNNIDIHRKGKSYILQKIFGAPLFSSSEIYLFDVQKDIYGILDIKEDFCYCLEKDPQVSLEQLKRGLSKIGIQ